MKNLIRSSMKLLFAVGFPLLLFNLARHVLVVQELWFGLKATVIQSFGTSAEHEALIHDTAREAAARGGTLESYLAGEKVANALRAVHELNARDPRMTEYLFDFTGPQRAWRPELGTNVTLKRQACKCTQGRVK